MYLCAKYLLFVLTLEELKWDILILQGSDISDYLKWDILNLHRYKSLVCSIMFLSNFYVRSV